VVIETEGAALTRTLSDLVAVSELASETCTVNVLVPDPVGVPEIIPVAGSSARPAGKLPEMTDQLSGGVPPVAAKVAL
jgi:hypothetical protein